MPSRAAGSIAFIPGISMVTFATAPLLLDAGDKTTSYLTGRYLGNLALKVRPKIELVFAAGDILAVGAMQEMLSQGVNIPEEMGVCGFGGLEIAQAIYPALTTVQANLGYIGKRAAELLMAQIDRKLTPIREEVGFTIVPGSPGIAIPPLPFSPV